jgi:hypothetical protein
LKQRSGFSIGIVDRERNEEGPSIVMYTLIHSRYCNQRYIILMEWHWSGRQEQNFLLDLPACWVLIRLCVALNDLERAIRYFTMRLKEGGFNPTYGI